MKVIALSLLAIAAAACGGSRGAGAGEPPLGGSRVDLSAVRADLEVYTDGSGHMIALVEPDPEKSPPLGSVLFYGDGKTMHAVPVSQYHADGLKFDVGFRDPRIPANPAGSITRELGKVALSCYGTEVALTKLPAAESQAIVGAASFVENRTRHAPLALVKDGDRYLYVDYEIDAPEGKSYRVWSGKKGKLERIPLESAAYDERANEWTFRTKKGVLKGMRDPKQPSYTLTLGWEGKTDTFTSLSRAENWKLIYEELGLYPEGRSPTPCDPMMAKSQ